MFFTTRCPAGWTPFTEAAGRVAVPTIGDAPGGTQRGTPLASGEDRGHTHALALAFSLGAVSYVGAPGGLNEGVGTSGSVAVETTTAAASTGLPYIQLLVCRKTTAAVRRGVALPPGMLMFFAGARCPAGFSQPAVTQGRLPVAAPPGAINGATFGGAPLGPADAPTHAHDVSATLATSSHGIALASGCCARDYARNDRYTASRPTAAAEPLVPTIQLLQCQKD